MPTTAKPKLYSPRHPERTLLYQIVAEHYETWLELASAGQLQQGQLDVSLNGKGQWQAQRTAKALADEAIDAIYTSDLSRARATAQAIADHSHAAVRPTVHLQTGLRGRGFGRFEGLTYAQIATDWPEDNRRWRQRDPSYAPEGGETLLQMRERVAETVHLLASQHAGEQIVLVAHGGVMDALYRLATQQTIEAPRTWELGDAAINRLLWTPNSLTLVGWSDTRHLEDATLDELSA